VVARKVAEAIGACVAGEDGWEERLRKALGAGNLLHHMSSMHFAERIAAGPSSVRDAVAILADPSARPENLDAFAERIDSVPSQVRTGTVTNIGAQILMAREPETYPPYRAEFTSEWARTVGFAPLGDSSSERYQTLLALCDELLVESAAAGIALRDRLDAQGLAWTVLNEEADVRWTPMEQARLEAWRRGEPQDAVVVARGSGWSPEMEDAAWRVLGAALRGESSAMAPDLQTWRADVAADLQRRVEQNPDTGGGTFLGKLHGQLADASDEVIVLTAELLYIHAAPLTNLSAETKIKRLSTILGWTAGGYALSEELEQGLRTPGSFNGGVGFNIQMWNQLTWLCRFVIHWLEASPERRAAALRDPYAFLDISESVPKDVPSIRYSVEYLAWPGTFPWVSSPDHRKRMVTAMAGDFGGPTGTSLSSRTRDLVSLRQYHQRRARQPVVNWYQSPYLERWLPGATPAPRAWLVRPSDGGSPLVRTWQSEGFVSLKAEMLGTVAPGASEADLRSMIRQGYHHLDRSQQEALTTDYYQFLTVMKPDDVVVTIDHDQIIVGLITDGPEYAELQGSRLRRRVTWSSTVVERSDLSDPVPSLLEQQGHVVDLTAAYDVLASYFSEPEVVNDDEVVEPPNRPVVETVPRLAAVTEGLAQDLFMDRKDLQEIVDLLQARHQVVLYGPPGTGKTYIAQKLAKHLVGSEDPSRVRLVQFHPSYSYEDFFEGYRPSLSESGQPTFELKDGPLRLLAGEASTPENRGNAYVLIIDEMNRANLAKVFGELYFLLEYRKETVRLQYQPETPFRLPPNLFIIGTMNTADRSIALVDAAIRRRFPFYELHPNEEPVKSVLERYLHRHARRDDRAHLLKALNQAIGTEGRDLQIGPSYLMRPDVDRPGGIERVWKYDLMPLLEEHYYGHKSRETIHREFGLDAIRAKVDGLPPPAVVADESPDGGDEEIDLKETGVDAE